MKSDDIGIKLLGLQGRGRTRLDLLWMRCICLVEEEKLRL